MITFLQPYFNKHMESLVEWLFLISHYFLLFYALSIRGGGVFRTCLSGPEDPSKKEGMDKYTLFSPLLCTERKDVKYQNDPRVEEVLGHQRSILVLHELLQVDCTSLI